MSLSELITTQVKNHVVCLGMPTTDTGVKKLFERAKECGDIHVVWIGYTPLEIKEIVLPLLEKKSTQSVFCVYEECALTSDDDEEARQLLYSLERMYMHPVSHGKTLYEIIGAFEVTDSQLFVITKPTEDAVLTAVKVLDMAYDGIQDDVSVFTKGTSHLTEWGTKLLYIMDLVRDHNASYLRPFFQGLEEVTMLDYHVERAKKRRQNAQSIVMDANNALGEGIYFADAHEMSFDFGSMRTLMTGRQNFKAGVVKREKSEKVTYHVIMKGIREVVEGYEFTDISDNHIVISQKCWTQCVYPMLEKLYITEQ